MSCEHNGACDCDRPESVPLPTGERTARDTLPDLITQVIAARIIFSDTDTQLLANWRRLCDELTGICQVIPEYRGRLFAWSGGTLRFNGDVARLGFPTTPHLIRQALQDACDMTLLALEFWKGRCAVVTGLYLELGCGDDVPF